MVTRAAVIPDEVVMNKIYVIRDQKVMLDEDLAELYGVETRVLNQAVTRNTSRFPEDLMFKLSDQEFANLKSQTVTSRWGGRRKLASNEIWISHKGVRKSFDRLKKGETVSLY